MPIATVSLYTNQIIDRVFNQVIVTMIIGCLNTLMAVIATVTGYGNILTTVTHQIQDYSVSLHQENQLIWVKNNKG